MKASRPEWSNPNLNTGPLAVCRQSHNGGIIEANLVIILVICKH